MLVQINTSWFRIPYWGWSVAWYVTNKSWVFAAERRLRKKAETFVAMMQGDDELFVSGLLYSNSSVLWVLHFHDWSFWVHVQWYYLLFTWLFQYVLYLSTKGRYCWLGSHPDIVERYLRNNIDNLHKKNLLFGLVKINISLLSCWRHFPSARMYYMFCLQKYCPGYLPRFSFSVRSLD